MTKLYGFKTAKGSFYALVDEGITVRLKISSGRRQYEVHERMLCLFLPAATYQRFKRFKKGYEKREWKLRLGTISTKDTGWTFTENRDRIVVPKGHTPVVCLKTKDTIEYFRAETRPARNLVPIEFRYDPDGEKTHRHHGHQIIKVFRSRVDFERTAPQKLLRALPPRFSRV